MEEYKPLTLLRHEAAKIGIFHRWNGKMDPKEKRKRQLARQREWMRRKRAGLPTKLNNSDDLSLDEKMNKLFQEKGWD